MIRREMEVLLVIIVIATICFTVHFPSVSGTVLNIDRHDFHLNIQNDTVFGNYSARDIFTYYNVCRPSVLIDVYDPDGVDSVWLTYRRANETSVLNQSMDTTVLGHWNTYVGHIDVNVSTYENEFIVQFHANDSLGEQTSSIEYPLVIFYNPPDSPADDSSFLLFAIGLSIATVVVMVSLYVRFGKVEVQEDGDYPRNVRWFDLSCPAVVSIITGLLLSGMTWFRNPPPLYLLMMKDLVATGLLLVGVFLAWKWHKSYTQRPESTD